jgi:branched-chain amino acid transport system ATP-binding protein
MVTLPHILQIENLIAGYNGKPVLNGINLTIQSSEICCIIGEEGSGKTTFVKAITQQIKSHGEIHYNGTDLSKVPTARIVKHGIDFISQGGNILQGFTVEEHILLAITKRSKLEKINLLKEIEKTFPKLVSLNKQIAGRLSGGERMILSMACILATNADFLLLDEPTAGLAPEICNVIKMFLIKLKKQENKSILLFEHNLDFAISVADSMVILQNGILSKKLGPNEFKNPSFIDNYLYGLGLKYIKS